MINRFNYFDLSLIVLISILTTSLAFISYPMLKEYSKETEIVNSSMCENKTLRETTECLGDYVRTFYNYTVREDTEKNISDIELNGGDCYDFTENIYKPLLENLGFKTKVVDIFPEIGAGHTFLITWDKDLTEYCKIDMLNINCMKFKGKNETK